MTIAIVDSELSIKTIIKSDILHLFTCDGYLSFLLCRADMNFIVDNTTFSGQKPSNMQS